MLPISFERKLKIIYKVVGVFEVLPMPFGGEIRIVYGRSGGIGGVTNAIFGKEK